MSKCEWLNLNYDFNIVIQLFTCMNEKNYRKNKLIINAGKFCLWKINCVNYLSRVQMIAELYIDHRTIFLFCAHWSTAYVITNCELWGGGEVGGGSCPAYLSKLKSKLLKYTEILGVSPVCVLFWCLSTLNTWNIPRMNTAGFTPSPTWRSSIPNRPYEGPNWY